MTRPTKRVLAVYGGSFDPPHIAHTLVCAYVLGAHDVDELLVIPTAQHPFDKPVSAFEHRLRMCELAMSDLSRARVSGIENELERPSLTLRTLEHLAREHRDTQLRLVIGSDLLPETGSWHGFARITELAPLIVVQRAGYVQSAAQGPVLPEVSSTDVRRRLRGGLSTEGLLSPRVAAYAREHGLYEAR